MIRKTNKKPRSEENTSGTSPSNKSTLLNSTDDSDIIECSFAENENKYPIKYPESSLKKNVPVNCKNNLKNIVNHQPGKLKNLSDSIRTSIKQSYGLVDEIVNNDSFVGCDSTFQTPCIKRHSSKSDLILNKIISTIKKTLDVPTLSTSKLLNIQQWLLDNDVETVYTPPFANLSITPRKCTTSKQKSIVKNMSDKENYSDGNSIDSEVEGVLRAVYGDDWMGKTFYANWKTEPKKKQTIHFSSLTEVKKLKSVKKNILMTKKRKLTFDDDEIHDLNNDSAISGIGMLNLDDSNCSSNFIKTKKMVNFRNKNEFNDENSNKDSISPDTRKKKKIKISQPLMPEIKKIYSKIKTTKTPKQRGFSRTPKGENVPIPPEILDSEKLPKKTFLASLSVSTPTSRCHPDAQQFKVNFKSKKEELVKKLYKLFNKEVFEGKLAEEMCFSWNVKLRGTAGYCFNKRITKSTGEIIRLSRIEFSTKIVDRPDRLRDTMIHELCHAASWVIDGILDGHGEIWRTWADKAMERFPELPPIKRCHNYEIISKYVYRCTGCGYSIKRHSKSINVERKRCGHCYGVLELLLNKRKKGKGGVPEFNTTRTLRTPNKFALFVKENYHSIKILKGNAKHAEIMKILGEQYALVKNGTKSAKKSVK